MSARRQEPPRPLDPTGSALDSIPDHVRGLERATRLGAAAAAVGFDWAHAADVLPKVQEEVDELVDAVQAGDHAGVAEELGDLMFTICNLARHLDVPIGACVQAANDKFARRFRALEASARADGGGVDGCTTDQLEARWQTVKNAQRGP